MSPSQIKQFAANRPYSSNQDINRWIQQASDILKEAATRIEILEKQAQEKVDK